MIEGIYILRTRRKDLGLEFRMYSGNRLHLAFKTVDDHGKWIPNKEFIKEIFGKSPVYDDYSDVLKVAVDLTKKNNLSLMDGICEITTFATFTFNELTEFNEVKNSKTNKET